MFLESLLFPPLPEFTTSGVKKTQRRLLPRFLVLVFGVLWQIFMETVPNLLGKTPSRLTKKKSFGKLEAMARAIQEAETPWLTQPITASIEPIKTTEAKKKTSLLTEKLPKLLKKSRSKKRALCFPDGHSSKA
jgi:hypothetical protein